MDVLVRQVVENVPGQSLARPYVPLSKGDETRGRGTGQICLRRVSSYTEPYAVLARI